MIKYFIVFDTVNHKMRHLGKNPQWLTLSKKVEFPPELADFYQRKLDETTTHFEKEFAEILHERKFSLINTSLPPKGLTNRGLMCFANASLQLLLSSPKFVSFVLFMKNNMRFFSPKQLASAPTWQAFCKFARAFAVDKYAFSTDILDDFFGPFSAKRKPLTQEDATEFTSYFLNRLHEELRVLESFGQFKKESGGWMAKGIGSRKVSVSDECVKESPITTIFGCLVRADTLSNGRSRSVGHEPYLVLPLQVAETLDESIKIFLAEEKVDDTISKKNSILSLPASLVIGFKRFAFDGEGVTKLNDFIAYPPVLTLLDVKYELTAIVVHIGSSPTVGHYVCLSKREGKWREYDDDGISSVPEGEELHKQAYMLLYNKIE